MLAGVFNNIGSIKCEEVEMPEINENEILVKVRAAAICGTDLRIYKSGHFKIKEGQKRILGHEFSGEIIKVGSSISKYIKGMKVGVAPNIGCGSCKYCRMGYSNLCPDYEAFGISLDGAFAEYVKINEKAIQQGNLFPFEDTVSFEEVALTEPLSCCYNAYKSVGTCPGDTVLIVGSGPMGVLHLELNRLAGAGKIMVADLSSERLKLIQKFSPDVVIDTSKEDLYEAVMHNTEGKGAEVIITACPSPKIQEISVKLACKLGRINLFGGLPSGKEDVVINTNLIHYNSLILTGTTGSSLSDYEISLNLVLNKKINVKELISKRFNISNIEEAFEYAMSLKGLKTVIEF